MISYLRRHAAPVVLVTSVTMLSSLVPHRAMADEEKAAAPAPGAPPVATAVVDPKGTGDHGDSAPAPKGTDVVLPKEPLQGEALPSGADKSGVTSQSISVPQGAGKISGMGESFSAQLSTGIATYSVPISLPAARGGAQPSLGLSYSSSLGHGVAGIGWEIGAPFIARQTDRGLARYDDPAPGGPWKPTMDRFVFNGGQELIPICLVGGDLSCAGAQAGEMMPAWSASHLYFRARVEGSYMRFFWSPDHKTWRVQDKSGLAMELGVPLNEPSYEDGLERDPVQPAHIYKWNLVRQYDAQGNANPASGAPIPSNAVVFRWAVIEGMGYLAEIFDTSPAANPSAPLAEWAHHTVLNYEPRTDPTTSYRRGWKTRSTLRLQRIDVASKTFGNAAGREMLRRYYFTYNAAFHPSLLESVQIEGRCSSPVQEGSLPLSPCPRLPPMTFGYQHVDGYDGNGNPQGPTLTGYEAIDERVHTIASSPKHSLDESLVDLFDIDSDGLPDVLATWPLAYSGKHAVFFHGVGGQVDTFAAAQLMAVNGIQGANAQIISLDNSNVVPQDLDGDGTVNLLHMPHVKDYAIYTPTRLNGQWSWEGRAVTTASQQSSKIDFTKNRPQSKVMDVDGDGLVDVVYSAGTQYQTFFSLGRHPDGDGQFGFATRTSPTASAISNDPVTSCVPYAGTAVSLSDPDVRMGDMNGDGFPDIVRIRQGDIKYWPGRGNGMWGTGDPTTCPAGTFAQSRDVPMTQAPMMVAVNTDELRLDDVNGDGLDDLVQVRFNAVDIWLNVDGVSWTPTRHTMLNTPPSSLKDRARLVDMNGSGTRDVAWGDGYAYKYIDLAGGRRPWVLTDVDNGLGKTTTLEYSTSVQQMLAAQAANAPWQSKMPTVAHVVTKVTERDHLGVAGRPDGIYVTDYEYRDPVFDGQQREFRGFRTARVTREGDANGPSAVTESTFLLGECKDETQNGIDECSLPERWRDNPREALKGLPVVSEVRDLSGTTLSTTHHTYRLRQLYQGLDGRAVRVAFESATDSYAYDTGPFVPGASIETLQEVELEPSLGTVTADASRAVILRSGNRVHIRGSSTVDAFGNATTGTAEGCVAGCPTVDETISTVTTPARRPDDPTGWMFRTVESYVTGASAPNVKRKRSLTTYDLFGNPTQVQAELFGTLPLDRFHENVSKSVASAPVGASQDGLTSLGTTTYDAFGNTTGTTAPNQRCRTVTYDTPFAQLATSETVFAGAPGGNCGSVLLAAGAAYDRGFALVTQVQDLHNEITLVAYDGFGRLSSMTKPDPSQTGTPSALPSVKVEYFLTPSPSTQPYSLIHTETQDGATPAANNYRNAWAYVDGMGRPILTLDQADPSAGDGGDWVVNGLTDYDTKGEARKVYLAWFANGTGSGFLPSSSPAPTQGETQRYDAFGRPLEKTHLDGAVTLRTVYHALAEDAWDAADLMVGPRYGTYATVRKDGHGRGVEMIERVHVGSSIEERKTLTTYLPSGEPQTLTRQRGSDTVTRWMRYDSLGRLVLNVDPHTTVGFNANPGTDPTTMKAWRYAYNDNGDLVGTSDARGCGENFSYDSAGRLLTEDYSPCMNAHPDYTSSPEVTNRYDFVDPDLVPSFTIDGSLLRGRLVSVSDRAQKTLTRFDGRGRVTGIARRVAVPSAPGTYAPRWYTQTATFDGADRPVDQTTGAAVSELLGQGGQSFVSTDYTKRGTVKSVGGSYGTLVTGVLHDADGLPTRIEYGDLAKTTTDFSHDLRRRLSTVQTYRGPPVEWTTPPVSYAPAPNLSGSDKVFQSILEDGEYVYDEVDNPIEIRDHRNPAVWPAGAKPVTKKATYDDLYRLKKVRYEYAAGDDTWVDPFDAETTGANPDPRRAAPSPHVAFDKRVLEQTYAYDWLGNLTASGDDAAGFYDRSLGTQSHSGTKPYQLTAATGAVSSRDGSLTLAYDGTGNTTSMSLVRHGACLPSTAVCSQRFAYDWDEVGRLARARRWDLSSPGVASDPLPAGTPAVDLRYTYDASGNRVLKTAVDAASNELHTVYVYASLELRRAVFDNGDFTDTRDTEVAYLFAHGVRLARLHYSEDSLPTLTSGKLHVLLELPDHLGSSSIVVDKETGELAERSTYQAYGGADSDYRPDRWGSFREDYRFTGKEEDAEVGLDYFGKRYLAVGLNRWLSADPLAVQAPEQQVDPNLYAYVHGAVLKMLDPVGLDRVDFGMGLAYGFGKALGAGVVVGTTLALAPEAATAAVIIGGAMLVYAIYEVATDGTVGSVKRSIDGGGTPEDHFRAGTLAGGVLGTAAGVKLASGAGARTPEPIGTKASSAADGAGGKPTGAATPKPVGDVGQTGQNAVASKPPVPAAAPPPPPPGVKPADVTTQAAVQASKTEQFLEAGSATVQNAASGTYEGGSATAMRAGELRGAIPPAQKGRVTMGVGLAEDATGAQRVLIGTSEPRGYLRPGVKLAPGELLVPGAGHAEADVVDFALKNGLRLLEVGATRPICSTCATAIDGAGARAVTPLKKVQ